MRLQSLFMFSFFTFTFSFFFFLSLAPTTSAYVKPGELNLGSYRKAPILDLVMKYNIFWLYISHIDLIKNKALQVLAVE